MPNKSNLNKGQTLENIDIQELEKRFSEFWRGSRNYAYCIKKIMRIYILLRYFQCYESYGRIRTKGLISI